MKRAELQSLGFEGTIDVALELQKKLKASQRDEVALRTKLAELEARSGEPLEKHGAQGEKRRKRRR